MFAGKGAIKGAKTAIKTVAKQGVKGALKTGARAAKGAAVSTVKNTAKAVVELGGVAKQGAKAALKNGKLAVQGIKNGFGKGAKSFGALAKNMAQKMKLKKIEIKIKKKRFYIYGEFNPKLLLASGEIRELTPDEAAKLRKQGDSLEIVGKKLDDGIVVSDDFARRLKSGEASKSFDELSSMTDDARRTEVMSSGVSKRTEYMGSTPSKSSKQGQEVIDRMTKDKKIMDIGEKKHFQSTDGKWYPLDEADMSHIEDAVTWWNKEGRKFGARSDEVREFMTDSKNYVLEHFTTNRAKGSVLG